MLIYASDLDQTLIYSERSRGMDVDDRIMIPAEQVDGRIISHISIRALEQLKQIAESIPFVPVTTRVLDLYHRIHIFREQIVPKYAITSNGAHILIDGQVNREWHEQVMQDVRDQAAPPSEAIAAFHRVSDPSWIIRESYWEDTFFSVLVDRDRMPDEQVMAIQPELEQLGWGLSIQGRKVYLVPFPVSKNRAIEHVKLLAGADQVIASGDSLLDRGLLDQADYAIAPAHGELYRGFRSGELQCNYGFTAQSGIQAAENILQFVMDIMNREGIMHYERTES